MEVNSNSSSKKFISRKNTLRRDSSNKLVQDFENRYYSRSEIKMLMLLCFIFQFEERKTKIVKTQEKQAEEKLTKTGTHFNRTSSTITIQPIKKEIIQLKNASIILKQLSEAIQINLINAFKKPTFIRKSHNATISAFNQSMITPFSEQNTVVNSNTFTTPKEIKTNLHFDLVQKTKTKVLTYDEGKENRMNQDKKYQQSFHKRMISSQILNKKSLSKQQSDSLRRQKFFMLRKKQQLSFLNKITVNFSSQQAEFKALVQTMEIFLKNLTRSNYYLKIIDQSIKKHHKILIYIQQLLKVFSNVIHIYTQLSTRHKVLNLKQTECVKKSQISYLHPLVDQYYEKSNETISIMRHFSVSPIFASFMTPQKDKCSQLITLFVEARYLLRYMEKEIQNLEIRKKEGKNLPKWQQAFRVKFLPKNAMF